MHGDVQKSLWDAIGAEDENLLADALAKGANPNLLDKEGYSPLCGTYNWLKGTELLLKNNADPNIKSPLISALYEGNELIALKLLEAGASVNAVDTNGVTVLMHAVQGNTLDVIQAVINRGADIDAIDLKGKDVFYYIDNSYSSNKQAVISLIEAERSARDMILNIIPDIFVEGVTIDSLIQLNLAFKLFDGMVDTVRLVMEPNEINIEKVALDMSYFHSIYYGMTEYSLIVSGVCTANKIVHGEYLQAGAQVAATAAFMALPTVIAYTGAPYLGLAYVSAVTAYSGYNSFWKFYDFYSESLKDEQWLLEPVLENEIVENLDAIPLSIHDSKITTYHTCVELSEHNYLC